MVDIIRTAARSAPATTPRIAVRVRLGSAPWHEIATFDPDDELKAHQAETVCEALCDLNPHAECEFLTASLGAAYPLKSYSAATGWRYGA